MPLLPLDRIAGLALGTCNSIASRSINSSASARSRVSVRLLDPFSFFSTTFIFYIPWPCLNFHPSSKISACGFGPIQSRMLPTHSSIVLQAVCRVTYQFYLAGQGCNLRSVAGEESADEARWLWRCSSLISPVRTTPFCG